MNGQLTIFDLMYPKYKIAKPIRMLEFFSGYGSTKLAWNYLGIETESYKTCEWAIKSIQAYKDIHFTDDNTDYSKELKIDEIKDFLFKRGISSNYNEPMTKEQVNRLNENQARTIYNNIKATHNLVNIQQVKGEDLEIIDREQFTYLLTYSFPCQDLSLAGKGKGMSDTSTRSGMLWEVERILTECNELGNLPQILLMENVPQVHSEDNKQDFFKWQLRLEELGYKNYVKDLIATDYGIPQTRNRCFMVSILGDYSYTFPTPIPLKLKLKDLLEKEVSEKYMLSDDMVKGMLKTNFESYKLENRLQKSARCPHCILVKNATKQGYLEAYDGDGVDISGRMEYHRGTVQKGAVQSLDCTGGNTKGVVNSDLRIRKLTPKECFRLMGVKDEDFEKCAKNQSDSSLYHLAGDAIVVDVIKALYKELL